MQESPDLPNEKELLRLISEGEENAFRTLFDHYAPLLYPMIRKVIQTENVASDIIQETFLRLWISRDKLPEIENPRAWILRIAYYRAFTFLRSQAIHRKAMDRISIKNDAAALQSETEDILSFRNTTTLIKQAVSKLPGQQKKVYQLSRENGYSIVEIARELNLSEQSVKNTMVRALKFIREYLTQSGYWLFIIFWINLYGNRY